MTDTDDTRALDEIAESVKERHCILFLGAGVHAASRGVGVRVPGRASADRRRAQQGARGRLRPADRFPDEDPSNLQRVALFFEIARSRHQLVEAVRNAVQVDKRPSPVLRALAELDFPVVITTNYDQLFENALAAAGKQPRVAVYTPNSRPPPTTATHRESPIIFKIHGDIARPETVVITDEDYIQFVLRMSNKEPYDPVPLTLKFYLTGWNTLFVGYSLLDYNLRLLFKTLRWKIDSANVPDMYSVDYHPDPLIFDVWHNQRRYVKFIAQDVWAFVPELYQLVLDKELQP